MEKNEQYWREKLRADVATCERILTTQGALPTTFLIHTADTIHIIGTHADKTSKRRLIDLIKLFAIAKEAIAIAYVMEAWSVDVDKDDEASVRKADREGVRSLDGKVETLFAMVEYRRTGTDGRLDTIGRLSRLHKIERNERHQVTGIGLNLFSGDVADDMEGPMTGLLLPGAPSPAAVALAAEVLKNCPELTKMSGRE